MIICVWIILLFKLTIDTDIPFARGLGSSSTCVVAGILACDAWFKKNMDQLEILKIATSIEGHPDNVVRLFLARQQLVLWKKKM